MAWKKQSPRRAQLPPNWRDIRQGILERDHARCQWPLTYGGICGQPGNEVDHRWSPNDHSPRNLWTLCHDHHARKTQRESMAAKQPKLSRKRSTEIHPGKRSS